MKIIETNRLYLRELTLDDKEQLKKVLSDRQSMQFYPHPFSNEEVERWIAWNIDNYQKYHHGLWAVILKEGEIFLGDCGITMQNIDGETVPEIGFHIIPDYCNLGYATEAATACKEYAFQTLDYDKVFSYTTVHNFPSQRVAQKMGMKLYKKFRKNEEEQVAFVTKKNEAMEEEISLHFTEKGRGVPFILLHGNSESHDYFVHQMDFFAKKYRVIAIDTRGHGQSPRGTAPFTIRQFAEDLHAFMVEHAVSKSHLLGFSDGGNIALIFTLKYPEMVDKLILNGANLNPKGVKRSIQIPIEIGYKIAKGFAKNNPKALKNAEMLGLMVNEPNIEPSKLQKIQNETLVIVGSNDMIKTSHSKLIYSNLQNAQMAIIKGNHFIANQNPDEFNRLVFNFLKQNE